MSNTTESSATRAQAPETREDPVRLSIVELGAQTVDALLDALARDQVALVRGCGLESAESLIEGVAGRLDLRERLELQAGFAAFRGHRRNVGRYFMSVNDRKDYQFFAPHSEGDSFSNMQLASFFCFENSTDGGVSILLNIDEQSEIWPRLREKVNRAAPGSRSLSPGEMARVSAHYKLSRPLGLRSGDQVLTERPTDIDGFAIAEVLAAPQQSHSRILKRQRYVYWDSIASIDYDSFDAFTALLKSDGLLKLADADAGDLTCIDNASKRRVWRSGADHRSLFRCKITIKLEPGDLIIQNNLTWAHSASNWTPGSGVRNLAAAFA